MRVEIRCAHPIGKRRTYYGELICDLCDRGDFDNPGPVIAYFDLPPDVIFTRVVDHKEFLAAPTSARGEG